MKKFLSKKPVMISFIVAAALFLAVYIGMLVRPVSYGFTYTYKDTTTYGDTTFSITQKINIKSDKYAHAVIISEVDGEKSETEVDIWIYRDGNYVYTFDDMAVKKFYKYDDMNDAEIAEMNKSHVLTEEKYDEMVKELKELKKNDKAVYDALLKEGAYKTDIFRMEMGENEKDEMEYANNIQAIVFTVVHGVVTVALVTFATLSLVFFIKRKKA